MYGALLNLKNAAPDDFSSLVYAVSGGEPLPDAISSGFRERFGVTIAEGYGMTECSPVTNWCLPHEYKRHSVGRPLPGVRQVVVSPESGEVLPVDTDGELRMQGPNIMRGYYGLPAETAAAFDERGYLRTGDMARLDRDGHLFITGRIKEMLIVGGENVFPREIEEVINRHPSVAASGVVGLRDDIRGEVPVAFVELIEDAEFDEQSIRALCRANLAGYKVPREIRRLDALPRNPTGKVLRRELTKMLQQNA
jgi:long-chain acyl-CoA synthetase